MRSVSSGRPGRQPMMEKREIYVRLIHQGMSNSAACRSLGIDRKTGHWWKNGGVVVRNGVTRFVAPVVAAATPSFAGSFKDTSINGGARSRPPTLCVSTTVPRSRSRRSTRPCTARSGCSNVIRRPLCERGAHIVVHAGAATHVGDASWFRRTQTEPGRSPVKSPVDDRSNTPYHVRANIRGRMASWVGTDTRVSATCGDALKPSLTCRFTSRPLSTLHTVSRHSVSRLCHA